MREGDVDAGQRQEPCAIAELGCRFLVSGDFRAVVLDLGSGSDVRD